MEGIPADATTPDGKEVTFARRLHVRFRHPEVGTNRAVLLGAVADPDETHQAGRGGYHVLERIDRMHSLVVTYELEEARGGL